MKHMLYLFLMLGILAPITASEPVTFVSLNNRTLAEARPQSAGSGPDGFFSEEGKQLAFEKLAEATTSLKEAIAAKNTTEQNKLVKRITGLERLINLNNFLNNETPPEVFFDHNNNLSNAGLGCYFYLSTLLNPSKEIKKTPSKTNLTELLRIYNIKKSERSQSAPLFTKKNTIPKKRTPSAF
jgi:hypothetical protein